MPEIWTFDDVKHACKNTMLTFFAPRHPGIRIQGVQFEGVPNLSAEEAQHLRGQVVEFRQGATATQDPVVAWALLHAPDWMAIRPGSWFATPHAKELGLDVLGLTERQVRALARAGYNSLEALREASDEELEALDGIGPATVKRLREDIL